MNSFNSIQSNIKYPRLITNSVYTFTPTRISGLKLWLDANNTNSLTKTGNAVTQWNDLVSNANISGTATYSSTGHNGTMPTIQFNGTSNKLNLSSTTISLTNFYYFAVLSIPDANRIYSPFSLTSNLVLSIYLTNNSQIPNKIVNGGAFTYNGTFRNNSVATPTNTFIIICLEVTNSNQTFYINSVAGNMIGSNFSANATNGIEIGNSGYGVDWFKGNMSEILVYTPSSTISLNDRQFIEGYLAWKWGLQASLPNNHLYKTTQVSYAP